MKNTLLFTFAILLSRTYALQVHGNPHALWSCLSGKGWDLETISNPNFTADSLAFNRRLSFEPVAIVSPSTAEDVSGIVKCAAENRFPVSALSGGHSYAAFGLGGQNGQVVVNLHKMKNITLYANGTVTSQTGNRLGDLASAIWFQGKRALPHGTCPYVGSGGHAGYGGFGLFSRQEGLLIDKIVSAQVVLANGTIVTASNTSHTDVFWAIRGSSPSFGIVTAYNFQTVPAPPTNIVFTLNWTESLNQSQFVDAFAEFQKFSEIAPNELGFDGDLAPDGKGGINLSFLGVWHGGASKFNSTISPFLSKLPPKFNFNATNYDWFGQVEFLAGGRPPDKFFAKSLMTTTPASHAALNSFAKFLYTEGVKSDTNWFIGFDLYGGKISQVASNATAYANRNAFITYQFYASAPSITVPYPRDGIRFVTNMLHSLEPNPQEAYPNYIDPTLSSAEWKKQYFGPNYDELARIKRNLDPTGVFSFPQSIGSA
ncbi:FAD-binding domain-containing protein [Sistotremastrum niveocremeum HHB9708]|uniref:FAD-binding domain-containing protein n=2 Tax=Sistotremastraceae TaxID=3402574 RepID=A0A164X325_9AGAM|nr:FAD-binding domain-containing protein [Sistotremastrum niveocremeum HHB9708]KZT33646.1 FAD-binding domain-containing protein [Sistotremastrum suecicum HHB10207 ss-3]